MKNRTKSILKNQASHATAPQSPPKDHPINPIRAGTVRSPTMNVAPDCHQHETTTGRTTTEAVDLAQPTINTETTLSKPKTKRIKRSLLLEPPPRSASPKMRSRTPDPLRLTQLTCSCILTRCCKRHTTTGRNSVLPRRPDCRLPEPKSPKPTFTTLSSSTRQSGSEAENPPSITTAATNVQSEYPQVL